VEEELEGTHGMAGFGKLFNLLRFYTPEEIIEFWERDIRERSEFLADLFSGQEGEGKLEPVINVWKKCKVPPPEKVREFYESNYGRV